MKHSLYIPSSWGSDMTAVWPPSPAEMGHFSSYWGVEMTLLCDDWLRICKTSHFLILEIKSSPPPSLLSLQYFLMLCRARVRGVSWMFDLAGPNYSPCRHLVLCTKNSPTITLALSYPHWQHFLAEFIFGEQNVCEWRSGNILGQKAQMVTIQSE